MRYPVVTGERETLALVCQGRSLARFGDGEFNLIRGKGIKSQAFDVELQKRLRGILADSGACLVGIPNMRVASPKQAKWHGRAAAYAPLLTERSYVSAFVSRPDSAAHINTADYWQQVESLWRDQDVTLVRGSDKSLRAEELCGARSVNEIRCSSKDAWAEYPALLERIGTVSRALLCLGPTATVLAVDLCARGVHAVDLGHLGLFWRKFRHGQPPVVTEEDKAA